MSITMGAVDILYFFVVRLVHLYKWIEFQVFKVFSGFVEKFIIAQYEKIGTVLEIRDENRDEVRCVLGKNTTNMETLRIRVYDRKMLIIIANQGFVGLGETFMDGLWDCDDMVEISRRYLRANLFRTYLHPWNRLLNYLELSLFNMQTTTKALEVAKKHYDLGNDLYQSFLDPWMQYTCGYWKNATNLNDAQIEKMELIAKKLNLKPGMRVLDLGCGWGTLCKYLAQNYGVECVGVNISKEGVKFGREASVGLPVDIRLADYRDINEKFDRVVSVGLLEHVGSHNYETFFEVANRCLKDDGIFLLHCIGFSDPTFPRTEGWLATYIFPNGSIPFDTDIINTISGKFILEDWHNFGIDYAKTLAAWSKNFNGNWDSISLKYGERFKRMWNYYLDTCQAFFLARRAHLWQVVLTKQGVEGEYRAAR